MTVLSHQSIIDRCSGTEPLILGFDPALVRSAAYDLRIGDEYFLGHNDSSSVLSGGPIRTERLTGDQRVVLLPPNQVLLFRTAEDVHLGNDLVGHLSLKHNVLLQGVIMASQSQIDAGYRGGLYILLYNLGDDVVSLSRGQAVLRLEFTRLDEPTQHPYSGGFRPDDSLATVIKRPIVSSLFSMRRHVDGSITKFDQRIRRYTRNFVLSAIGLSIAFLAVQATMFGPGIDKASTALAESKSQQDRIVHLQEEVEILQERLESSRTDASDTRSDLKLVLRCLNDLADSTVNMQGAQSAQPQLPASCMKVPAG